MMFDGYSALALPRTCGGCGADGTLWCVRCAHALGTHSARLAAAELQVPVTVVLGDYRDVLRRAVVAHKSQRIARLVQALRALLVLALGLTASMLQQVGWWHPPVVLVTLPPSKLLPSRIPMMELLVPQSMSSAQARGQVLLPTRAVLRPARKRRPQKGLDRHQRERNIHGSIRLSSWPDSAGFSAILIDDVITTGASMNEAARVLKHRGVLPVAALALAHAHSA